MSGTWPTGWASGDIVTAAEYAKGVGCIYDTTLGIGAASVDITGIVGSYANLFMVVYCRSDTAAASAALQVRFNGDTGANYTVTASSTATAITDASVAMAAASATSGLFSAFGVLIPNYASTVGDKPAVVWGTNQDTSGSNLANHANMVLGGGIWRNTTAITRVTVSPAAGSLVIGSRVSLYAMGS